MKSSRFAKKNILLYYVAMVLMFALFAVNESCGIGSCNAQQCKQWWWNVLTQKWECHGCDSSFCEATCIWDVNCSSAPWNCCATCNAFTPPKKCCDYPYNCCPQSQGCCGSGCYDPATQCCINGSTQEKCGGECCPKGKTCINGHCCCAPNGCGPCDGPDIIPDNPTGCDDTSFLGPCNAHDECYGTCGSNKDTCDGDIDSGFLGAMLEICMGSSCAPACSEAAYVYYGAVQNGGKDAFDAAQACSCG